MSVLTWHFVRDDRTLAHDMGHRTVRKNMVFRVDPPVILCEHGLHGSVRAIDAIDYAPGSIICRTEHSGEIVHGDDKIASSVRKVLWWADASRTLHEFACDVAEEALTARRDAGDDPDARSWNAIAVKRAWINGNATDQDLDAAMAAARAAAWGAAWDAAWDAARAAARAAARGAARNAAWDAARDAAWGAAWVAARGAARAAARGAQNDRLTAALEALEP